MKLKIRTNNHWRNFRFRDEVPGRVLRDQFDYQNEADSFDGFFCYKGHWYHLDNFMRIEHHDDSDVASWHGYAPDSFFSGVVIRISDDCEQYQIGTYIS